MARVSGALPHTRWLIHTGHRPASRASGRTHGPPAEHAGKFSCCWLPPSRAIGQHPRAIGQQPRAIGQHPRACDQHPRAFGQHARASGLYTDLWPGHTGHWPTHGPWVDTHRTLANTLGPLAVLSVSALLSRRLPSLINRPKQSVPVLLRQLESS